MIAVYLSVNYVCLRVLGVDGLAATPTPASIMRLVMGERGATIIAAGIAVSIVIALSGTYDQILNYVVSVDFIFFGLTGLALVIFRRRGLPAAGFRTPLHPVTTLLFVAACWLVVIGTFVKSPANSAIGLAILLTGLPAWWFWSAGGRKS
ncbi:MAG TPA: hypothetical protein VE974_04675 [Thermoanaerobaculia bacterium]|nr:hypothetical protein [Thermoanaerobaculia bacterium]